MPAHKIVSDRQMELLVEHMETNKEFAIGRFLNNGPFAKQVVVRRWEKLATTLNTVGGGAIKTGAKWRDYWNEKKYSVRRKASELRHAHGTGGGPAKKGMTSLEERILAIIGKVAMRGNANVQIALNCNTPQPPETVTSPLRVEPLMPPVPPDPHITSSTLREMPIAAEAASLNLAATSLPQRLTPPITPCSSCHSTAEFVRTPPLQSSPPPTTAPTPEPSPPSARRSPRRPPRWTSVRRRRRLAPTTFGRVMSAFVAIEHRRLALEETRLRQLHERETERLRIDSQRVEVDQEHVRILDTLATIAQALLDQTNGTMRE